MAKKRSGKKAKASPTVTLRYANPGRRAMAKKRKKTTSKRRSPRRSNPSKLNRGRRRRRNPSTFAERAGKLAAGAAVTVATAIAVTFGTAKISPGSKLSLYGIPALTFLAGVGIARTMPTLGVGIALGSFAPFALPLTSKLLTATSTPPSSPAQTAAGISRAMRAVSMGRYQMRAVDLGAVDLGMAHQYS